MTSMSRIDIPQHRMCEKPCAGAAIGNTVEWFDFAIYSVLATFIADKFFPSGQRHRRAAQHVRDLRGGLLHATARRLLLRAAGRPNRPATRAGDRDPDDVGFDVRDRPGSELRRHRRRRSTASAALPLPAGLFGRRRVRQRRVLPRGVRPRQASWLRRFVPGVVGRGGLPAGIHHRHRAGGGAPRGSAWTPTAGAYRSCWPVCWAPSGFTSGCSLRDTPEFEELRDEGEVSDVAAQGGADHVVAAHPADRRAGRHSQRRLLHGIHVPAELLHQDARVHQDGRVHLDHRSPASSRWSSSRRWARCRTGSGASRC